jgi:hypothetical protein
VDFGRAPGRILSGHPADEFLDFGGDSSSTRGWSARPPAPIQPKSCAMPTHHRLRLHDQEHLGQRDQTLRNAVQNNRSIRLSLGRGRLRFRTATCWRKARISRARSVRHVKKTLTAVAKSRMNRSMNLPLYHGQVSDSVARQSFGDEQGLRQLDDSAILDSKTFVIRILSQLTYPLTRTTIRITM